MITYHFGICLDKQTTNLNHRPLINAPRPGDIDCPGTYNYDVLFRVVPGFTFAMAQSGKLTPDVEQDPMMSQCSNQPLGADCWEETKEFEAAKQLPPDSCYILSHFGCIIVQ